MAPIRYTHSQLLERIAQKDGQAFSMIYGRYYQKLCEVASKRLAQDPIVEEIVQDVFLVLWDKAAQLEAHGDVKNYLFAILRNKILYEVRSQMARLKSTILFEPLTEICTTDASHLLQAKELERELHAIIEKLSPQSGEAFKLSRYEQMSYKRIAAQMDISVDTVEKHVSKALSILRKKLYELDSSLIIMASLCLIVFYHGN